MALEIRKRKNTELARNFKNDTFCAANFWPHKKYVIFHIASARVKSCAINASDGTVWYRVNNSELAFCMSLKILLHYWHAKVCFFSFFRIRLRDIGSSLLYCHDKSTIKMTLVNFLNNWNVTSLFFLLSHIFLIHIHLWELILNSLKLHC